MGRGTSRVVMITVATVIGGTVLAQKLGWNVPGFRS